MPERIKSKQLTIKGMTCSGCAVKIERKLKAIEGIVKAKADYVSGKVMVTYDESKVKPWKIKQTITALDYEIIDVAQGEKQDKQVQYSQIIYAALIILGAYMVINRLGGFFMLGFFPEVKQGMSYAAIFVIGLLTSVHCVGMCGGICLSQCVGAKGDSLFTRMRPSFLYNLGRILSYTMIGSVVGALGGVISLNGVMRGAVALFAGALMVIMGLNMLNIFPWLRKFSLNMPKFLTGGIDGKNNSPFYVGLMNGFMPCGPLQAMQLYALSTGSPLEGGISMFLFAFGTSFLMFGFGTVSALLTKAFTSKLMTASAVLVIVLGVGMFNTGMNMSGFLSIGTQKSSTVGFEPVIVDGYQMVEVEVSPRGYGAITVKKGIPVKFNLHAEAKNISGCNNAVMFPKYGIQTLIKPGDNIVEFTPTETGVVPYSCWMNMIRSSITVVE